MTKKPDEVPKYRSPGSVELLSGATLMLATLGITGVVIHELQQHRAKPDGLAERESPHDVIKMYRQRAAILNDDRYNKRARKLSDLNRLAALIVVSDKPTRQQLQAAISDLSGGVFASTLGYLTVGNGLAELRQDDSSEKRSYYYTPSEALLWAAGQPREYQLLTEAIANLASTE